VVVVVLVVAGVLSLDPAMGKNRGIEATTIGETEDSLLPWYHAADLVQFHKILFSKLEWRSRATLDVQCLGVTQLDSPDFT
jgi:hypothetical protein